MAILQLKQDKMSELQILKEVENPLFERKEIQLSLEAEVIPSRIEVRLMVAGKFSISPHAIKIKKITGQFGSNVFLIDVNLYPSQEKKDAVEFKTKKEKVVEAELAKKKQEEKKAKIKEKELVEKPVEEVKSELKLEEEKQEPKTEEVKKEKVDTTGVPQGGASTSSRPREQGTLYKGQESKSEDKKEV